MGFAASSPWHAHIVAGHTPRPVLAIAGLAGSVSWVVLAGLAAGQGHWLGVTLAALAAAAWPAMLWRRTPRASHSLRVSDRAEQWELGGAAGWQPAVLSRRWQTGRWLTLEFIMAGPPNIAVRQSVRRLTVWRGQVAPQAWRRLSALSAATPARASRRPEALS